MAFRRITLLFSLALVPAGAQNEPALEIHGIVSEVGLNLGLAGAEVTIFEFTGPDRDRKVHATAATDARGEFTFHLDRFGDYYVEVRKQAYSATISQQSASNAGPAAENTGTLVSVSAAHPSQEVRLALMRPGALAGIVIDENDSPVSGMLVQITRAGLPALAQATTATGKDGSFTANSLIPGEYLVKVSRGPLKGIASMPNFSEEDLKVVDQEPQTVYWPEASDENSATAIRVSPSAPTSLGTIRMRTTPSYRARVSIEGCKPDDLPHFLVATPNDGQMIVQNYGSTPVMFLDTPNVACQDFLIRGLKPGSYTFVLSSKRGWAATPVEVTKKNLEVALTLLPPVDVTGRFVAAEGATLPAFDKVQVTLFPAESGGSPTRVTLDSNGTFLAGGVMGPSHRVRIEGLGDKYYVKEIRLDGRAAADGVVRLYRGSQLEIVIDDQPGAITGSVTDGDKPFSQPLVFVAKWPSLEVLDRPVTGDNGGQFQIMGLTPGEYRVLAVQSAPLPDGQQIWQGMLSKLWSGAEKVTVERGGSQTVPLKLSDPLR